jgi:hypothetical protein
LPAALAAAAILFVCTPASAKNKLLATPNTVATVASLEVYGYPTETWADVPATGLIQALDSSGSPIDGYNGVVMVTTSQSSTPIPVAMEEGEGVFFAAFATADTGTNTETITATGTAVNSSGKTVTVTGTQTGITVYSTAQFVVTVSTDTVDDGYSSDVPTYCTDQSLPGATPDKNCSLREALYAADQAYFISDEGATITFSSSVFKSATTITLTPYNSDEEEFGALYVPPAVAVIGPTTVSSSTLTNLVTISGNNAGSVLYTDYDPSYPGTALANLNITGGNGTCATGDCWLGGGINNWDTLTLTNVNLTGNTGDSGGAIINWDGAILISGGTISGNTSTAADTDYGDAGAILDLDYHVEDDAVAAVSATPTHRGAANHAASARHSSGSMSSVFGMHSGNSRLLAEVQARRTARINKMSARHAAKAAKIKPAQEGTGNIGVGPDYVYGVQTLNGVTISGNTGGYAGGIYSWAYLTGDNVTFSKNTANFGAGALVSDCYHDGCYESDDYYDGNSLFANSIVNQNSGGYAGGAVTVDDAYLAVSDSTFSSNTSSGEEGDQDAGGVVTFYGAESDFLYDTFAGNISTSTGGAGALFVDDETDGYIWVGSDTLTGNSGFYGAAAASSDDSEEGDYTDVDNSLIAGNTTTDPNASTDGTGGDENGLYLDTGYVVGSIATALAPLGNYGGPTETVVPLPGNPAICAGDPDFLAYLISYYNFATMDQRGYPSFNTTYPGFSSESPCVDSGAVQSNFSISFTTEPLATVPPASVGTFSAAVTVSESGTPVSIAGIGVSATPVYVSDPLSDSIAGTLTGGSATTNASGVASFGSLGITAANETTDYLLATLGLYPNASLSAASTNAQPAGLTAASYANLTAQSTDFTVGALDFTIAPTDSSDSYQTLMPGSTISFQVTTTPIYPPNYAGPLTIECVNNCGLPTGYTVTFTPSTISANAGAYTFTVSITAPLTGSTTQTVMMRKTPAAPAATARKYGPLALALLLLPLVGTRRMRRRAGKLARLVCLLVALAASLAVSTLMTSCNGNSNGYFTQAPQNYSVTVTATAGSYTHTYQFTLNVQ